MYVLALKRVDEMLYPMVCTLFITMMAMTVSFFLFLACFGASLGPLGHSSGASITADVNKSRRQSSSMVPPNPRNRSKCTRLHVPSSPNLLLAQHVTLGVSEPEDFLQRYQYRCRACWIPLIPHHVFLVSKEGDGYLYVVGMQRCGQRSSLPSWDKRKRSILLEDKNLGRLYCG